MKRKLLLLLGVLALSACQDKEAKETTAIAPAPASAPVAEVVSVKPVASFAPTVTSSVAPVTAPKVAAPQATVTVPVVEIKPAVMPPVSKPDAVLAKIEVSPATVKPAPTTEAVSPSVVIPSVSDADGIALAKKRNCFACHMLDKKVVGPAWKAVAAKYRGDADAQARMEAKIGKGGSGAWGSMAMPPQPLVTAEERAILARFILNLK
jgi:cytochrome c